MRGPPKRESQVVVLLYDKDQACNTPVTKLGAESECAHLNFILKLNYFCPATFPLVPHAV